MQMNGISSLIDAAHYYKRWSDPRLIVLVLHNNDLNQVTWEQRVLAGDTKLEASQDLPDFPFADYARTIGLDGVRVDDPDQIRPAWERAMKSRPTVCFRGDHRPERAAAAAAHPHGAGQEDGHGADQRRPRPRQHRQTGDQGQMAGTGHALSGLTVTAYEIPTDAPESDGTLEWDSTAIVVVEAHAGGLTGLGFTYGQVAVAEIVTSKLAAAVDGVDALAPQTAWAAMTRAVRNSVNSGLCAYAISAVDVALHDLKARLLGVSLADLLGRWHDGVDVYGSGGFTSYSLDQLRDQAQGWVEAGFTRAKIKVARDPSADGERLAAVREVIGNDARLMVDANGAFTPQAALRAADETYAPFGVSWLEEPVSSDDHAGLRRVRDGAPAGMEIAAGEYGTDIFHFQRLLDAEAVDVLQADVTRCGGVTGVRNADALAKARCLPLSAHCAPAISAHVFAACETAVHLEYFHDHVRVESLLFDGTLSPAGGKLIPDRDTGRPRARTQARRR